MCEASWLLLESFWEKEYVIFTILQWRPLHYVLQTHISRVSCQKGPTHHAYAWLIGPFWQDTLDIHSIQQAGILIVNRQGMIEQC